MSTDYSTLVTDWYQAVQFRNPPAADLAVYVAGLTAGTTTEAQVQQAIENDPYTQDIVNPVIREYQAAFGRVPLASGESYWVNVVAANPAALSGELATSFASSPEFETQYGTSSPDQIATSSVIAALYQNVLGRAGAAAGIAYWTAQNLTVAQALYVFSQSPEFITNTESAIIGFQNGQIAGDAATSGSLFQYGNLSFTLTPGTDHVSGYTNVIGDLTPFFYNGTGPTLNPTDVIQNVKTLTITDAYAAANDIIPLGATLTNIQNVVGQFAGNAGTGGAAFDTTGITGVKTLTVTTGGSAADYIQASQTTDITATHNSYVTPANISGGGGIYVAGGHNVTVTSHSGSVGVGNLSGGGTLPLSTAQLATGDVVVNQDASGQANSGTGNVNVFGGVNVTVDVNSSTNTGTVDIGNTYNNTGIFSGALADATNPTGAIIINSNAQYGGAIGEPDQAGLITIFGGTTVNVTAAGVGIQVGDPEAVTLSDEPTGDVTIVNTAPKVYSDTAGTSEDVWVSGGAKVNVTTNTGDVWVGNYDDQLNTAGTGVLAGVQSTGAVTITETGTNDNISIGVYGGSSVSINSAATIGTADIQVGDVIGSNGEFITEGNGGVVNSTTGDITIFDNAKVAWAGGYGTDASGDFVVGHDVASGDSAGVGTAGIGHEIYVVGGDNVSITTNTASVTVGGIVLNADGTAALAGENPTGNVTIVENATAFLNDAGGTEYNPNTSDGSGGTTYGGIHAATVTVYGGDNVNVTAAGDYVQIGDDTGGSAGHVVIAPTGTITVVDTATETLAWDGVLNDVDGGINVDILGGTTVTVTTNVGGVYIGEDYTPTAGAEPTGDVTVTNNSFGDVEIYGGKNVTVTSNGGWIQIGDGANPENSALTNPTGTVTVTESAIQTGWLFDTTVKIEGAGVGSAVTVNTTGGDVLVGSNWTGDGNTPVTGAVVINDTFGGVTQDYIGVYGGTTVNITTSASTNNAIQVGGNNLVGGYGQAALNADGTGLLTTGNGSTAQDPTGNVTIYDATVNGATTTYGKEHFEVITNGGTTVSVTGGASGEVPNIIGDVQSQLVNGVAAGVSTLANVSVTGVTGELIVGSDALANLTIDNSTLLGTQVYNDTLNSALTINLANDTCVSIITGAQPDSSAVGYVGTVVVNATGTTAIDLSLFSADSATSLTLNDAASLTLGEVNLGAVKTITVTGSGNTNLGDWTASTALTSIDASTASGGVEVAINPGNTSFTGDGKDVVFLMNDAFGPGVSINGGGGSTVYVDAPPATPLGNIGFGHFLGFTSYGVVGATGTYNVEGFENLIVGGDNVPGQGSGLVGVTDTISFTNAAVGATLDLIDPNEQTINYGLQAPVANGSIGITIGLDGVTEGETATVNGLGGDLITSVSVDSQGTSGTSNSLALDSAGTSFTITGDSALLLTDVAALATTINASGASGWVDVTGVGLATTGVTVTGGSGGIKAYGSNASTAVVDTFNVGTGGGSITLGAGGAGYAAGTSVATGSETVNLAANSTVGTTIGATAEVVSGDGSFGIVNGWNQGTIGSGQTGDSLVFSPFAVVIANSVTSIAEQYGIYNVSNGVISLATGSPIPSATQALTDAETIIDAAPDGTIAEIEVTIKTGPNTTGPALFVLQHNTGGGAADTWVELAGVTGAMGFGALVDASHPADPVNVGAGSSISIGTPDVDALFANVTATFTDAKATNSYDATGNAIAVLDTSTYVGTDTITNLGNFGVLEMGGGNDGNVVVTQVGVDAILTLTATGDVTLNHLTYGAASDATTLALYAAEGSIDIGTITDASNSGTSIAISGSGEVTIGGISDTALKTVDASTLYGELTLTVGQAGVTIVGTAYAANTIVANGAADTITIGSDLDQTSSVVGITANGAGDHISVYGTDGASIGAAGAGDVITLVDAPSGATFYVTGNGNAFSSTQSTQLGAGDTINVGDASNGANVHTWLGANSTVNLAACSYADIHLLGDTAGTSLTNLTVINGVGTSEWGSGVKLHFNDVLANGSQGLTEAWAGGTEVSSQVNVASATSLSSALNIAANQAVLRDAGHDGGNTFVANQNTASASVLENNGTGLLDWFQYGGNTYIVEAVNSGAASAAHPALGSHDIVVELTGIVNMCHVDVVLGPVTHTT